jgi:hypothetical protein
MIASNEDLFSVLRQYNPWWDGRPITDLPIWRRAAFGELKKWIINPPAHRAVMLSGARQVGKTTLFLQAINQLIVDGIDPEQILYVTFDHPLIKLTGLENLFKAWRELRSSPQDIEYLFLDEIQYTENWQTWIKHQIDFDKSLRIAITGSATPLAIDHPESGVGRWHTIKLPTLSFYEYLQIKEIKESNLPKVQSLNQIFQWNNKRTFELAERSRDLIPYFHDYLLRGGFPQPALVENISTAQRLLREDIVDKVLKRDMTALFGVRRVLEMEKIFLYLCLHDGGILDITQICKRLELKKSTVNKFIELLEASHLIYKLPPLGYGKQILRAKHKVYLADAALAGSVMLKGKSLLEDSVKLSAAVETAFFKHVFTRFYQKSIGFSYWQDKKGNEVDIVAEVGNDLIPFEVKYQQAEINLSDIKGILKLCDNKELGRGYVITKNANDFGVIPQAAYKKGKANISILKIPAPLACYWLSQSEAED